MPSFGPNTGGLSLRDRQAFANVSVLFHQVIDNASALRRQVMGKGPTGELAVAVVVIWFRESLAFAFTIT